MSLKYQNGWHQSKRVALVQITFISEHLMIVPLKPNYIFTIIQKKRV